MKQNLGLSVKKDHFWVKLSLNRVEKEIFLIYKKHNKIVENTHHSFSIFFNFILYGICRRAFSGMGKTGRYA